jgi:transcriptional regulator with XRE-family HTH domain
MPAGMALDETQKETVRRAFADRLRSLREQTGLSQDKFALEHGQHRTWIGHLERAERAPTLYSIIELARAFGITPSELLDGIDV